MDDTQSRASDASATRKRRSSILKSQRPPRTPFSELEFNVATPTDTVKSRRVSFSKRTGVAEFVTNEATTTWKNFYEEHNKSLESSGNDSGANASRQPIGHLGKRIFEQQFEEVEAVDFITSLDNLAVRNVNTSLNVNFTEQLASLENTNDKNLTVPQNNFELTAFTDHNSKIFGDDLAINTIGEMSGKIDINFSAVQSINVKDDLDEIQRDLQRQSNIVGPAPFRAVKDFSEYIEVELNSPFTTVNNEESDMSITETIPSPKVSLSKTPSLPDKKSSLNWVSDKENNCVNDLKAKTYIHNTDMSMTTALPSKINQEPGTSRTIIFENALADLSMTKPLPAKLSNTENNLDGETKTIVFDGKADMSITMGILEKVDKSPSKMKTLIFNDDLADLSMTKALPVKLMVIDKMDDKSKTNVFVDASINLDLERRRTMIFDDGLGDLSMTKPIPAKILSVYSETIDKSSLNTEQNVSDLQSKENATQKRRSILFEGDLGENFTGSNIQTKDCKSQKRRTILFKDDLGDLSITKPIPGFISIQSEIIDKSTYDFEITGSSQAVKCASEKEKSMFKHGSEDISMTRPIPAKLLTVHSEKTDESHLNENVTESYIQTKDCKSQKRRTILFEDDLGDLSMTKPIPAKLLAVNHNVIIDKSHSMDSIEKCTESKTEKRKTILFEDSLGDLSMTKPIPAKLLSIHNENSDKSNFNDQLAKSILYENCENNKSNLTSVVHDTDITVTQEMEPHRINTTEKRKTVEQVDLSLTEPIPANLQSVHSVIIDICSLHQSSTLISDSENIPNIPVGSQTQNCRDDLFNLSLAKLIPVEQLTVQSENPSQELVHNNHSIMLSENARNDTCNVSTTNSIQSNILAMKNVEYQNITETIDVATNDITKKKNTLEHGNSSKLLDLNIENFITTDETGNENPNSRTKDHENDIICEDSVKQDIIKQSDNTYVKDTSRKSSIYNVGNATLQKTYMISDLLNMSDTSELENDHVTANISSNKTLLETNKTTVASIPKDLPELEHSNKEINLSLDNKHREKIEDMTKDISIHRDLNKTDISMYPKSFREVDNTKDILEMLSDLTDDRSKSPVPVTGRDEALESKDNNKPRRVSMALNRQSIVLSREDLLTNISMAQAALQMSIEIEDSDVEEQTPAIFVSPPKICARVSNELVKTLHFEDESSTDLYAKSDSQLPSQNTACGETTNITDSCKALPPYLKDISDGIDYFVDDSVKPMNDQCTVLDKRLKKSNSTCRNETEANLNNLSLKNVTNSNPESCDIDTDIRKSLSSTKQNVSFMKSAEYTEVSKYCPAGETQGTLVGSDKSLQVQSNIENVHSGCHDTDAEIIFNNQSMTSTVSEPIFKDQSLSVKENKVKNIELNTDIHMQKNEEILEVCSSPEFVDDALAQPALDVVSYSIDSSSKAYNAKPVPLNVINKLKEEMPSTENTYSDLTSNDEADTVKAKKRIHSPASSEKFRMSSSSKLNITPKPTAKMQRLSSSPNSRSYSLKCISGNMSSIVDNDVASADIKMDVDMSPNKHTPKKEISSKTEEVSKTVQQSIVQKISNEQDALSDKDSIVVSDSPGEHDLSVERSSFSSSENQCKTTVSTDKEWALENIATTDGDASINVVTTIGMLPFMGSHECEWASSGTDSWSFRLLHGRIRLHIRLAHRHHNATRTRVRGDTPVLAVTVHRSHHGNDKKNSVAVWCISFACAAIRAAAGSRCSRAGDVPALLRRAAGVTRRALHWGRAMHDARVHLAYSLDDTGRLVLKVANIPLRRVWEVSMVLQLCAEQQAVPWPRADDVRVTCVLDGQPVPADSLRGLLDAVPAGWGHVPATLWKVFKYLKNMTSDTEWTSI